MKKLMSLALAVMMLACAFAVAEQAQEAQVWYLLSVGMNGTEVNVADANSEGTMTLNPDGTGKISITSNQKTQENPFTYAWKDNALAITSDGTEVTVTPDEKGHLTINVGPTSLTFTKDQAEVGAAATGETVSHKLNFINTTGMKVVSIKLGKMGETSSQEVLAQQVPDGLADGGAYELTFTLPASLANGFVMVMDYTTETGIVGHVENVPFDDIDVKLYLEEKK